MSFSQLAQLRRPVAARPVSSAVLGVDTMSTWCQWPFSLHSPASPPQLPAWPEADKPNKKAVVFGLAHVLCMSGIEVAESA